MCLALVVVLHAGVGWCTPQGWESLGPFGACDGGILMDPVDPKILYSLSWHEGVFKSTDSGETWHWMNHGYSSLGIYWYLGLAISPANPDELYFVARDSVVADDVLGLYRSEDGGESWEHIWTSSDGQEIYGPITVSTDGVLLAHMRFGERTHEFSLLGRSMDGGATWEPVMDFLISIKELQFHPSDSNLAMFAGVTSFGHSEDAGLTWTIRPLPVPYGAQVRGMEVSPNNPDLVYILTDTSMHGAASVIFRTVDRGDTWEKITDNRGNCLGVDFYRDPVRIFTNYSFSPDGGQTWTEYSFVPSSIWGVAFLFRADDPSWALYATDYGLWELMNDGITWSMRAFPRDPSDFISDSDDRSILYLASRTGGVFKSIDAGTTWRAASEGLGLRYTAYLVMDPEDSRILYNYGSSGIFKSIDGAQSWRSVLGPEFTVLRLAIDPFNRQIMLARVTEEDEEGERTNRTMRSTDGGQRWDRIGVLDGRAVASITFHPRISGLVYATDFNPRLFLSRDSGVSWTGFDSEVPDMPERQEYLQFDSQAEGVLYCTSNFAVGFRKSVDWGATWFDPCPGGPFTWADNLRYQVDPDRAGTLYCGWRRTMEGAMRWKALTPGIGLFHEFRQEDGGLVLYGSNSRPETHGYRYGLFRHVQYDQPATILMAGYGASRISASSGGRFEAQALVRIPAGAPQPVEVELCWAGVPLGIYLEEQGEADPSAPENHFYKAGFDVPPAEWAGRYEFELVARDASGMISDRWPRMVTK